MAVSLGTRISGLLVVGAVAVAVAAFNGDGSGTPDSGGGGGPMVTAGPSSGTRSPAAPESPTLRQSPAGEANDTALPNAPDHTGTTTPPASSASPTPSATNRLLLSPGWLPPGPVSPNADAVPDPSSVYDMLHDPGQCRAALTVIPTVSTDPEWRLLRALTTACLAVQGKGGSWETAAREYTALTGKADTCKGRAVAAALGGLLDFHRQHPGATVQLKATSGGTPACAYQIAGVDTGGDGQAQPGDTIGIELQGTFFDPTELLRFGTLFIGAQQVTGPLALRSQTGDKLVLSAVVQSLGGCAAAFRGAGNCAPSHDGAADDRTVDVVVRYRDTEARLQDAFTVMAPAAAPSPPPEAPAPSGTPQRMLPLGPLTAHLPGT